MLRFPHALSRHLDENYVEKTATSKNGCESHDGKRNIILHRQAKKASQ